MKEIAEAYVAAGSDIIETNSFGATSFKLKNYKFADKVQEFNFAAANLAKQAMGDKGFVAASVGPTGHIVEDEGGDTTPQALYDAFKAQVIALAEGGADAICIETMSSIMEAVQAIKATKENTNLPVICTFTFEHGAKGFRTMMGAKPDRASKAAVAAGADIVGANCGNGIRQHDRDHAGDSRGSAEHADPDPLQRRSADHGKWKDGIQRDTGIHGFVYARTRRGRRQHYRRLLRDYTGPHHGHGKGSKVHRCSRVKGKGSSITEISLRMPDDPTLITSATESGTSFDLVWNRRLPATQLVIFISRQNSG